MQIYLSPLLKLHKVFVLVFTPTSRRRKAGNEMPFTTGSERPGMAAREEVLALQAEVAQREES